MKMGMSKRLVQDRKGGRRQEVALEKSLFYLPFYAEINSENLAVSDMTPEEAPRWIACLEKE